MIDPATDAAAPDPAVPHQATADPPAVARRRLRLSLRRAREAKGYTRSQVASALDWSLSKINRIEGGEVTISTTDLTVLLAHLDVADPETVNRMIADARAARGRGWSDRSTSREHLTPATLEMIQFEAEATKIRYFSPALIPGIAQTRDYGAAILNFWSGELPPETLRARLEVRLNRFAHVLDRPNPPDYLAVLDESVIMRDVGGPEAMAKQLQQLLDLIQRAVIRVRIVPMEAGVGAMCGAFTIFELNDNDTVLYTESQLWDQVVQTRDDVQRHERTFTLLLRYALDEAASNRLIAARHSAVVASLDRQRRAPIAGISHALDEQGRDQTIV